MAVHRDRRRAIVINAIAVAAAMIRVQVDAAEFLRLAENQRVYAIMRFAKHMKAAARIANYVDGAQRQIDRLGFGRPQFFAQLKADANAVCTLNESVSKWYMSLQNLQIEMSTFFDVAHFLA